MKYCINYYSKFRHLDEIDEIIFPFSENLPQFFESKNYKPEQRLLIYITKDLLDEVMSTLIEIKKIHPNMAAIIDLRKEHIDRMKENGIPYFFHEYCKTYDQVYTFIELGATDVYIVETLGFNLKNIGAYCHRRDVNVRVLPNVIQSTLGSISRLPQECQFFIRPQDTYLYEPYVDVFEIFGSEEKYSVNYEIYKSKEWNEDLVFLIQGMSESMMITHDAPFGGYRLGCHQDCFNCQLCTKLKNFNNIIAKANLKLVKQEETESDENK